MAQLDVIREFFAIRFERSDFGARPDQTHPHLVDHPLSEGRYVVREFDTPTAAYIAGHAAMATIIQDGPLKGRSMASGGVEVIRAVEHAAYQPIGDSTDMFLFAFELPVTMTITGMDKIPGIPHFAEGPLSRYNPVNGWDVPKTIDI